MEERAEPLQVEIRPLARPEEREFCARLMIGSEPWRTLGRTREDALGMLDDTTKEIYVARVGELPAGFIVLDMRGPFRGYIQNVAVAPEWRNRGIGSRLIAFAEGRILRECPNVFLCVSSFNTAARRLYARLGYGQVGELRDYLVAGHSEVLMRKTLGPIIGFDPSS